MIRHIVLWKFKAGEDEKKKAFLDGLRALDGVIPEIRFMEVRESANEKNDYDAVLISDFDSLEALERYKTDPRHVAVSSLCKSIRETRAAIDVER